ncbi:hypothetical protein ACFTQL_08375 [Peribacillus butanolivorans]|uniref:hypothetical protein n=1 Tax=Peribacillus butanolivorans TaxID=421767 RepID=UPI003627302B
MIRIFAVILLAGLMLIGCSSQTGGKTFKEESELNDPADYPYLTNKNNNKQTVIHEIDSK